MTARPRLPVPPGRPRTEVAILAAQSLVVFAAWAACASGVLALPVPQWTAIVASVLLGACLGLYLWVVWMVEAPRRIRHARRWRDDPDYRQQWSHGL